MALKQTSVSAQPTFSFWVKRWRAYLDATQKEFASLWGVSASMVQKIEVGDYELGQLSFERLERLRELLDMTPAEFYGILTENKPANETELETNDELLTLRLLDSGTETSSLVSLPQSLIGNQDTAALLALKVVKTMFATDRMRYAVPASSLLILNSQQSPQTGDIVAASIKVLGQTEEAIFHYPKPQTSVFLRPYNPKDLRAIEIDDKAKLELRGIFVAAWVSDALQAKL